MENEFDRSGNDFVTTFFAGLVAIPLLFGGFVLIANLLFD